MFVSRDAQLPDELKQSDYDRVYKRGAPETTGLNPYPENTAEYVAQEEQNIRQQEAQPSNQFRNIEQALYQRERAGRSYWDNPQRVARYYLALKAGDIEQPAWLDKGGLENAYRYLEKKNEGKPWWEWQIDTNDPGMNIIRGMATPPDEFLPDREKGQTGWSIAGLQGAEAQAGATTQASVPGSREVTPSIFYTPPGKLNDNIFGMGITRDVYDALPAWKKALIPTFSNPVNMSTILGGALGVPAGPIGIGVGATLGTGIGLATQELGLGQSQLADYRLATFQKEADRLRAAGDKQGLLKLNLDYLTTQLLDYGAELPERVIGTVYQAYYEGAKVLSEGGTFAEAASAVGDVLEDVNASYRAANLYYETMATPPRDRPPGTETNLVKVNRFPLENPTELMTIDEVGGEALAEARNRIKAINRGESTETINQVRDEIRARFGVEGMARDLAGHVFIDLYNLTPLVGVAVGADALRAAGLSDIAKSAAEGTERGPSEAMKIWRELAVQTPGNELSKIDKLISGVEVDPTSGQASLKWMSNPKATKNPFEMTPQAKATEAAYMVYDNLVDIVADAADADEVGKTIKIAAKITPSDAAQLGGVQVNSAEMGVIPLTLRESGEIIDELVDNWKAGEQSGKRPLIQKIAGILEMEPQKLVDSLAEPQKANDIAGMLKNRVRALADAGNAEAAKVLVSLNDPADPLTGDKLYNMAADFRNGNFDLSFEGWKAKVIGTLEQNAEVVLKDYFGVHPPGWIIRTANAAKSVLNLGFLAGSVKYVLQNLFDNNGILSQQGLFSLDGLLHQQKFIDEYGVPPARWGAGVGGMAEAADHSLIGKQIKAAMKMKKPGLPEKVSDIAQAITQKYGFATKLSGKIEEQSSRIAWVTATKRYMDKVWKVGTGYDEMPQNLGARLDDADGAIRKRIYRAIEDTRNGEQIDANVFGDGYKTEKLAAAFEAIPDEDATFLKQIGIYDELRNKLSESDNISKAFDDVSDTMRKNIKEQILRDDKANAEVTWNRIKLEGIQAAIEEHNRMMLDRLEFNMMHHDDMDDIFAKARTMKKKEARAFKASRFAQSEDNWRLFGDRDTARQGNVAEALSEVKNTTVGKSVIDKVNDIRAVWSDYYNKRGKWWQLKFEGEDNPGVLNTLKSELQQELGGAYKFDDNALDLDAEYARVINEALSHKYRTALEMESGIQDELDAIFSELFGRQFENPEAAVAWRAGQKDLREMMAEANIYFRTGDASGLMMGDTRQALKAAIDDITGGKNTMSMSFDERAELWPRFKNEVYRPLISQYMKENQVKAGAMAQTPARPQPLPPERIVVPTKPITNKQAVLDLANRYGITTLTKGGLEPQVLYVIQKFYPDIKSLDDVTADIARDAILKHWEEKYPGKSIGDIEAWKAEAPRAVEAPAAEKQPWEMTIEEYKKTNKVTSLDEVSDNVPSIGIKEWLIKTEGITEAKAEKLLRSNRFNEILKDYYSDTGRNNYRYNRTAPTKHEKAVKQALSEGKPVPPEVLKDYLHLEAKYYNARKVTEAAQPQPVTAGIPFMLTNQMKADLERSGLTSEQIRNMTPADAIKALDEAQPKAVGGIPTEITDGMRKKLTDLGYDERQISKMNPPEAQSVIDQNMAWRITDKTKRELRSTGYTDEQIRNMTPGEAWDIVNANNEPASVGMPLGTVEQFTPNPPQADAKLEAWYSTISPALRDIERRMLSDTTTKAGGDMAKQIENGLRTKHPEWGNSKVMQETADTLRELKVYLGKVKQQQRQVKHAAGKVGVAMRDYALLNYGKRTNFDTVMGVVFPYQFWYTRNMMNWAMRFLDRPSILSNYARLQGFMQSGTEREGFPTRLRGKVGIQLPFLPDWMGDVYFDPMRMMFPWTQFIRPFKQIYEQRNLEDRKTISVLYDMQNNSESGVTPEAIQEAIDTKSGQLWEQAHARALNEVENDLANPFDYATLMYSPNPLLQYAYSKMMGREYDRGALPPVQLLRMATSAAGIGPVGGINLSGAIRRGQGLPEVDKYYDYRVDQMLANMVGDGEITVDEAKQALISKAGDAYETAVRKVDTLGLVKYIGAPAGIDFIPEGEQAQRAIRGEYDNALEAKKNGDAEALNKFYDKYPEYEVQKMAWDTPDERIRRYLISEVWDGYNNLPELHQKEAMKQLGSLFSDGFMSSETRDYDSINTETLAQWAQVLGGDPGGIKAAQMSLNLSGEQMTNMYQNYAEEKARLFPNINEAYDSNDTAKTKQYEDWRQRYMESHPNLAPLLISERSDLYGAPENVQVYVYKYRAELNKKYPGIYDKQDEYYAQATSAKKKAYLNEHPELLDFWDWRRQRAADMPEAAAYIISDESMRKAILGEDYVAPQSTGSGQTLTFAESKKPKPLSVLDYGSMDPALLRQVMGWALVGQTLSEGAKQELRRSWEKQGRPGKDFESYLLVVKEGFGQ